MVLRKIAFVCLLIFSCAFAPCKDKLSRAFEAMNRLDYYEAKRLFEKSLDKNFVASSFGLSQLFSIERNPYFSIDSAELNINAALSAYFILDEKEKLKLMKWNVDTLALLNRKDSLAKQIFDKYLVTSEIDSLFSFKNRFATFSEISHLNDLIEQVAFENAKKEGSLDAFSHFISNYPEADQISEARKIYNKLLFEKETSAGTESELAAFIEAHPESPYLRNSQDELYSLFQAKDQLKEYKRFIQTYSDNPNIQNAIDNTVELTLYNFEKENLEGLIAEIPDLENNSTVEKYLAYFHEEEKQNKLQHGSYFNDYKEGIMIVEENNQFSFKRFDEEEITHEHFDDVFEFEKGLAIIQKKEKFGLLDRRGNIILNPVFSEIGEFSDGLIMAFDGEEYRFFDQFGKEQLVVSYVPVGDFENGELIVKDGQLYGMINRKGELTLEPAFDWLEPFDEQNEQRFKSNGKYGLRNKADSSLLAPEYSFISGLNNGTRLLEKDDKIAYRKDDTTSVWFDASLRNQSYFNKGYVPVLQNGKWGLLDSTFNMAVAFGKKRIIPIGHGQFAVMEKNKMHYLDIDQPERKGKNYGLLRASVGGLIIFTYNGFDGLMDKEGHLIYQKDSTTIGIYGNYFKVTTRADRFGLLNEKGEEITAFHFEKIDYLGNERFKFYREDEIYVIDFSTDKKYVIND